MITSKIVALSLLLIYSFASARVQLQSDIEIFQDKRTISKVIELDEGNSALICDADGMHIEINLLGQEENKVRYSITAKKDSDSEVKTFESHAKYGDKISFIISNKNTKQPDTINKKAAITMTWAHLS